MVCEVEQMPCAEFDEWLEYFKWKSDEQRRESKKNSRRGAKGKRR